MVQTEEKIILRDTGGENFQGLPTKKQQMKEV